MRDEIFPDENENANNGISGVSENTEICKTKVLKILNYKEANGAVRIQKILEQKNLR